MREADHPKHVPERRTIALRYRCRMKGADGLFFERAMQRKASDAESLIQKKTAQVTRFNKREQASESIEHPDALSEAEVDMLAAARDLLLLSSLADSTSSAAQLRMGLAQQAQPAWGCHFRNVCTNVNHLSTNS